MLLEEVIEFDDLGGWDPFEYNLLNSILSIAVVRLSDRLEYFFQLECHEITHRKQCLAIL